MSDNTYQAVFDRRATKPRPGRANTPPPIPLILSLMRLGFRVGGVVSPRLTGRLAYELWFKPTRFDTPASEQAVLDAAEIAYRNINGIRIATYSWGCTGPTVLLVHGWSGRGTQLGAFVEPLVSAGFRVLSFDCPAHGRSAGKQTTLFEIADVMLALNDHFGPFESVITHSFGGPCLAVAIQRGFTTQRVVSISPPATVSVLVETFADTLSIPEKVVKNFVQRFKNTFGNDILQRASMQNNVRDLVLPALIIHDEDDADIPWQQGQAVADAWNNASFVKTRALGHRRILRDVPTIETAVDFIQSGP